MSLYSSNALGAAAISPQAQQPTHFNASPSALAKLSPITPSSLKQHSPSEFTSAGLPLSSPHSEAGSEPSATSQQATAGGLSPTSDETSIVEEPIVAKISHYVLREERGFHIAKSLVSSADRDGEHIAKPIEFIHLPPIPGDRGPIVVAIYQFPGANHISRLVDLGPAFYFARKVGDKWEGYKNDQPLDPPISLQNFLDFAVGASQCLEMIHHRQGIVHGEIRGDAFHFNLDTKKVKLIAFGSGQRSFEHGLQHTKWSTISNQLGAKNRFLYISPEQTGRMPAEPDARTDIYSLGVLLWTLLTQRPVYEGDTPIEIMRSVLNRRIPSVTAYRMDVPDVIARIIMKCTDKNVNGRYHSASGLKYDLIHVQQLLRAGDSEALRNWEIGSKDISSFFNLPDVMIGRDKERADVIKVLDRVAKSHPANQSGSNRSRFSVEALSPTTTDLHEGCEGSSECGSSGNGDVPSNHKRADSFTGMTTSDPRSRNGLYPSFPSFSESGDTTSSGTSTNSRTGTLRVSRQFDNRSVGESVGFEASQHSSGLDSTTSAMSRGLPSTLVRPKRQRRGHCEVVAVEGVAGVGKTSLMQSITQAARKRGYCATAKFDTAGRRAFGPMLSLLSSLFKQLWGERSTDTEFHRQVKKQVGPTWATLHELLGLPESLLRDSKLGLGEAKPLSRSPSSPQSSGRTGNSNGNTNNHHSSSDSGLERRTSSTDSTSAVLLQHRKSPVPGKRSNETRRAGTSSQSIQIMKTFLDVLRLFTEHKFICFCLDDLQFGDEGSLELISQIIGARLKMVIVISYRPEESDKIQRVLSPPESEKTPSFGTPIVTEIKLTPLSDEDISEYVALTLRRTREEIAPLALVIQSKTAGNPFYMREMLSACYRKKCIEYDYDNSQWTYDLDRLFEQFKGVTDYDVLDTDFITRRLNELPPASRSILAWAALLGQTFSFEMVCKLLSGEFRPDSDGTTDANGHGDQYKKAYSQQDAVSGLHAAIQAYIIVPSDVDDRFRFAHDRYVQAAAALKECYPRKMHFIIAQTLLKYYASDSKWKESTASHICEAVDVIRRRIRHRQPFRKLLCECAQASIESGARATAAKYYGNAVALLQPNPWEDGAEDVSYAETMQLYLRAAECYLYMGRLSAASDVLQTIFTSSETAADRAEAWVLESRIHAQGGNSVRALECLKECLKALGVQFNENPTWEQCDAEFTRLADTIEGLDVLTLLSPPELDSNDLSGVGGVLAETISAGFWSDGLQFYHLSLVMMDLHLTRGAFPQSGMAFMHMALIALTRFNKAAFAMQVGEIALQLIDKYRDPYCLARGYMIFANWVGHLQYKISHMVNRLEGVVEAASGADDRISTIVSIGLAAQLKFSASENCADLEAFCLYECEDIPDWHKDTRGGTILIAVRQTCRALQGKTRASDPLSVLSDDQHDSAKYKLWLNEATKNGGRSLLFYETMEMVPLFLYGHYEQAIKIGQACYQNRDAMWSCRNTRLAMLFYGLALAGTVLRQQHNPRVLGEALPSQVKEIVRQVGEVNDKIKEWQALSDINYRAWTLLLDAQVAELLGETDTAMRLYEMAVDHAEEQNFVFEAALGHYLLANIFIRASTRRAARYILQEAIVKFRQFGAVGIADRIETEHSLLLYNPTGSQRYVHTAVQTDFSGDPPSVQYRSVDVDDVGDGERSPHDVSGRAVDADLTGDRIGAWRGSTMQSGAGVGLPALDMIDLSAILTCSQRISSVLRVDELLKTMCDVILQTCGGSASLAAIVVQDEGSSDWCVAASGDPERGAEAHLPGIPLSGTHLVAENVVLYCTRFREVLFLRDLLLDERFGNVGEQWLQRNPHSKAVIAIPISHGDKQPLLGVVYLEGGAGSFTDRNVEVLQLLVDQIGISYSNALAMKAVEKVSAEKAAMVDMQKQALAAAQEAEKKAKDAEAEAKRNVKLAEEAAKAKSIFLANVSHELRTPLNGVIGNSELLRDSNLNKDQLEMADSIRVSADLLLTVINDILDFSRMEADKMKLYVIAFNPEEMVREVVRAVSYSNREKASKKNVKIIQDINLPPMLIYGDPIRLHQVLGNLIGNSLKFTEHGSITIGARVDNETDDKATLTFWVQDTGIGISQQQMKKLFLPFSQADASTARKYGGSGLGLSICKSLIETMMKGKIELDSKEQQGTKAWFTVTFDKAPSEVVAGDAQGAVRAQPGQRQRSMSVSEVPNHTPYGDLAHIPKDQLRISIAEDNEINARIALTYLKRLGYTQVDTYDNGQKAVEGLRKKALEGKPYHVVLMDVQMPVLDGYEATKLLRNDSLESVRKILVIAMTASAIQGDREKCLAAGMNDYLAKPVKQDVLKRKLETYLSVQSPNGDSHDAPASPTSKLLQMTPKQPADSSLPLRSFSVSSPLSRQIDINGVESSPMPTRPADAPTPDNRASTDTVKTSEVAESPSKRQPKKLTKARKGSDVSMTEKQNNHRLAGMKSTENIPPGS